MKNQAQKNLAKFLLSKVSSRARSMLEPIGPRADFLSDIDFHFLKK